MLRPSSAKILVCAPSAAPIDAVMERVQGSIKHQDGSKFKLKMTKFGRAQSSFLADSDVVFTTLTSTASPSLKDVKFDLVIIYDAAKATEIATFIPFQLSSSVVLFGDDKRFSAKMHSEHAAEYGLAKSFFERCVDNGVVPHLLSEVDSLKIHPAILSWPNRQFYGGKLTLTDGPDSNRHTDPRLSPFAVLDVHRGSVERKRATRC